ncbi:hypothetical protein PGTUg99_010161 [Puccinia graminis f. sp. tritici]|uniref:Secreted protein n=1 Tax=Puccinia graminis f. sp. tritici TaxID=56615 RepID=A0A5B0QHL8_PUCGR|nr:hypothetical protein PGTUg99_010161 [Puccinia graminis f. sp. tritici]
MIPKIGTLCVLMAFITTATARSIGCIIGRCTGTATEVPLSEFPAYPAKDTCGEKIGSNPPCRVQRAKEYFKCGGCKSVIVKNGPLQGGEQERCDHLNLHVYIQWKPIPEESSVEDEAPARSSLNRMTYYPKPPFDPQTRHFMW